MVTEAREQRRTNVAPDPDCGRAQSSSLSPKLVMSLGNPCDWFLGPFFGDDWKPGEKASPQDVRIADLNDEPLRVRDGVVFVTATHPSHLNNRTSRVLSKEFKDETGLLVHARRLADIPDAEGWDLQVG